MATPVPLDTPGAEMTHFAISLQNTSLLVYNRFHLFFLSSHFILSYNTFVCQALSSSSSSSTAAAASSSTQVHSVSQSKQKLCVYLCS